MELQGKVALVTGAGRRLGQAMARALADRGMTVAIHYHTSMEGATTLRDEIVRAGGRADCFEADLRQPALFPNRSRTGWDNSTSWSTRPR
jgi:NAD(P)-dependent dehydrogenase (short-subunit alcohol dehydrogenase family)